MSQVIEVAQLSKRFSDFTAVDNLSFTVNQGDVFGFLGQNGAGKSTTIRMLLTLIKPSAGTIKIFNSSIAENRNDILSKTGAMIERPDLYQFLTAMENLEVFARLSGLKLPRQKLFDKLGEVGLADRADSKVKTFSQGMKQRLGIAVAMVHNPSLIILDEPTNGLDPQGIADMRKLIVSLSKEQGKTVLISSHLLSEMEQMATRLIIIDKGKKVVEGDMKELLDPSQVLMEVNTIDQQKTWTWISASPWGRRAVKLQNGIIQLRIDRKDVSPFAKELLLSGADIISIHPRNSLEEYFLAITRKNSNV